MQVNLVIVMQRCVSMVMFLIDIQGKGSFHFLPWPVTPFFVLKLKEEGKTFESEFGYCDATLCFNGVFFLHCEGRSRFQCLDFSHICGF